MARNHRSAAALLVGACFIAVIGVGTPAPAGPRLIADAGDSAFLEVGEPHVLGGMAWGGHAPYRYLWSFEGSSRRFTQPDSANSLFKTDGMKPGDHDLDLTVTDAAHSTAHDTVRIRLYSLKPVTLFTKQQSVLVGLPDELAGSFPDENGGLDGQTKAFPFTLPAGLRRLVLTLSWTTHVTDPIGVVGVNDFDLYVEGPDPSYKTNTGGATAAMPETITIERPKAGAYKAVVAAFLSAPETYTLTVATVKEPARNPMPVIQVPPTYRFVAGKPQSLQARVTGASVASSGWDLNFDGRYETPGMKATADLTRGTHVATFKVVTKAGFEVRRTVGVTVADADAVAANTSPFVIIGIGDTGINPYHEEFSAASYPDPEVLKITRNFTRNPAEYIPGYPKDTPAIPITLGKGYLPAEDKDLWTREHIKFQKLYWIPGTKIIGAIDWTDTSGINASPDNKPILDEDGHGTETSSVSTGNRFGNCPSCLLVFAEGLQGDQYLATQSWIDIVSMSVGSEGNIGYGLDNEKFTKTAAERGQTMLYAAGNGFGNAFDVPMLTYTSGNAGPDYHVVVGAARTDNRRPIFGDANPVDISSWGDGTIPSACVSGDATICNFGGTSAATPLTAGVFGKVLREVRRALGDTGAGQRKGQVVAQGTPIRGSAFLRDGTLTRAELWDIVFHSAESFGPAGAPVPPYVFTWPGPEQTDYLFGGYGLATPESALHAIDVALGRAPIPARPAEDAFFALDAQLRDRFWGSWNDGSGGSTSTSKAATAWGTAMFHGITLGDVSTPAALVSVMHDRAEAQFGFQAQAISVIPYFMHHTGGCPPIQPPADPTGKLGLDDPGYVYMDRVNRTGDDEPCPNARATTVAAYYRPVGNWASGQPVGRTIPAGSTVDATVYLTMEHPMLVQATGSLLANGRLVGQAASALTPVVDVAAARCRVAIDSCWTAIPISFTTDRPIGADELIAYQVALRSSEDTYFGYEGSHATHMVIVPAGSGSASGLLATIRSVTEGAKLKAGTLTLSGAGRFDGNEKDSLRKVELSVDDPSFDDPVAATSSDGYKTWTAKIDLPAGQHTIYARAIEDRRQSEPDSVRVFAAGRGITSPVVLGKKTLPATGLGDRGGLGLLLLFAGVAGALMLRRRMTSV